MRTVCARRTAVCVFVAALCAAGGASAQTMDRVTYFADQIAEKGDRDHIIRLSGGSSWLLDERTTALVPADVLVVMRDVMVNGQAVKAAWFYVAGAEIRAKHVEGVYPSNPGFLTRVTSAEGQGTTLTLADGTRLTVPKYDRYAISRWVPPYKALLTGDRTYLYNLTEGRRVWVEAAKKTD